MIAKCYRSIDVSLRIWTFIILFIGNLFRYASATDTISECKIILAVSTVGTFLVCLVISIGLVILLRRRYRNAVTSRESQRKMLTENGSFKEDLHFQNRMVVNQATNELDGVTILNSNDDAQCKSNEDKIIPEKPALIDISTQTLDFDLAKQKDQVTIENQQDGTLGLSLSVAGLYVQAVCEDLPVKSGCPIEPGDEVLSINGQEVEGMSDMEALALLAKSGPSVTLEIVKNAFLWRVQNQSEQAQQPDFKRKKRAFNSQSCTAKDDALRKAKMEMDQALMELRRSTYKDSQSHVSKQRENSSPHQSLTNSVEVQDSIVEEEFVVIESNEASAGNVSSRKTMDEKSDSTKVSLDENDNSLPRTLRQKYFTSSMERDGKGLEMKVNGNASCFGTTQGLFSQSNVSLNASQVTTNVAHDQQQMRRGLSLSLPAVNNMPRKASPPYGRNSCATFTALKSASGSSNNSDRGDSGELCANGAFYIEYDENAAQYKQGTYNLDKINPPPSYAVASQIFNSQKPGLKPCLNGSLLECEAENVAMVNGCASQGSSFDEIEPPYPLVPSITCRDSVDIEIDEHVMRYMTKKYSEPRLPTVSSRGGLNLSLNDGPRYVSAGLTPSGFLGSPVSMANHQFMSPSTQKSPSNGQMEALDTISSTMTYPMYGSIASQSAASTISQSLAASMSINVNGSARYSPQEEESPKIDMLAVANMPFRKKSPEQSGRPRTDYINGLALPCGLEGPNISPRMAPSIQQRKLVNGNRVGRFYRQRTANETSLENIRRATSSPAVNSEHERSGSVESQAETVSGAKRTKGNRNGRKTNDGSFDRRKSIDSGSLRKLAAELQANQNLSDDFPMLSKLLGGAGLPDLDKTQHLYRYRSSDTLYGKY